jgi:hypothetical protein
MHNIPIRGDEMGLVFAIGVIAMILLALPEARSFLALSLPIGAAIAIILRLTRRD